MTEATRPATADHADIAIVGGGIVGLGIAYELSEHTDASIVVFDKEGPGAGTTGRSAGVICRHEQGPVYVRLSLVGYTRIREFERDHGFSFHPWGALTVVREPGEFPARDAVADLLSGAPSKMYERVELGREELLSRYSWLEPEGVLGGYFEPNIGFIDPLELVELYRRLLRDRGVRIMDGNPVLAITRDGDTVTSLATRRGRFQVGTVINASGPWGAKVAALAGSRLDLIPQRVQVALATSYDEPVPPRIPLTETPGLQVDGDGVWCRGEVGGATLFGSHRDATRPEQPPNDPDFFDRKPDPGFAEQVEAAARQYYRMPVSTFLGGWTCVYGTTSDGHPIISVDPQVPNLIHAVGMNGHGMTIHAGVARCVRALLLTGRSQVDVSDVMPWPEVLDFSELRADRFTGGRSIVLGDRDRAVASLTGRAG